MPVNLEESIDQDARAMERIAAALEDIAEAMVMGYKLEAQRLEIEHPTKRPVRDAIVSKLKTAEDELREDQGSSEESDEEWIGPAERSFNESQKPDAGAKTGDQAVRRRANKTRRR